MKKEYEMRQRKIFLKFLVAVVVLILTVGSMSFAENIQSLSELESKIIQGAAPSDLVAYAYQTNPTIKEARDAWKAVLERYRVTTAYPDPMVIGTYFPRPIETRLGPQDWNITLTQVIPFPGKLSKAGEIVKADARIARINLDRAIRDVVVKIRESFHELVYIREAKGMVAQNLDLINHLRKIGETAYAQDRAAFFDVVKAQSQSTQLQYDALLLEELEQTEKTQLNALLNRPIQSEIGPLAYDFLPPLTYKLDEIYRLASKYQEEIQIAETQIQRSEARIDLAKYENLPEFRVGLFYAGIGNPDVPIEMRPKDAGRNALGVQFGITIPLWLGKNAGRVEEARAEALRAQSNKTVQINETYAQIRSIYFRLRNSERLVHLYRDQLLPQAAQSLEIAETWFREKQGSFSDFVEVEAVFYNFQLALARAKADYGKYLARLEKMLGRSLVRSEEEGNRK
jgi:cobalt-zinc-cadmium efflux system outer membrane protein